MSYYPQSQYGYPPAQAPGGYPPPAAGYPPPASSSIYPSLPQTYPPSQPGYAGYSQPPQNIIAMPEPYVGGLAPSYSSAAPNGLPYPVHPTAAPPVMPPYGGSAYPPGPGLTPSYPPASYPPASYPSASYPPAPAPSYPPASYPPTGGYQQPAPGYSYPSAPPTGPGGYGSAPAACGYITQGQGTIRPFAGFNAEFDSQMLRKAMKGLGTDEQAIINVLAQRSNQQRQQLKITFKTLFGRDLFNDLSSELSFRFKQTVLAMMMSPVEYDADEMHRAIRGLGTNEETLVEILCTRSNQQIMEIRNMYRMKYRSELERDLIGDTSGHFRRFVVSLVTAARREDNFIDYARAQADARALLQAGEARWGTDESMFNQIFCAQSYAQLRVVFDEYQKIAHRSIQQTLSREMSGDLFLGMRTLANVVMNRPAYFADRLHRCMQGAGTNDDTLIRVIVSRSEVDLVQIKQEFQRQYGQTLEAWIQGDTSGDYRNTLLMLARGN